MVHLGQGVVGVWGSNGLLMAVRVGGVQIIRIVHYVTEENHRDPSLIKISKLEIFGKI